MELNRNVEHIISTSILGEKPQRRILERHVREVEAWGDFIWGSFLRVLAGAKPTASPDLASSLKQLLEGELQPRVVAIQKMLIDRGIQHPESVASAGSRVLRKVFAEVDSFVLSIPDAPPRESAARTYDNFTITGGHVFFGDGTTINIGSITLGDVLRGLEAEIDSQVKDPEERASLLTRLHDLIKHPAMNTLAQIGLPEVLRKLSEITGWLPK